MRQSCDTAIIRSFVRAMLSPCLRIFVSILALSVTFGDSSPKGRAFHRALYCFSASAFSARIPMSVRLCSLSKWMRSAAS